MGECYKSEDNRHLEKRSKKSHQTKEIYEALEINMEELEVQKISQYQKKKNTRVIMMARSRMVICGRNYKGTMSENCNECKVTDDANKVQFNDIYTNDTHKVNQVVNKIDKVWNLE